MAAFLDAERKEKNFEMAILQEFLARFKESPRPGDGRKITKNLTASGMGFLRQFSENQPRENHFWVMGSVLECDCEVIANTYWLFLADNLIHLFICIIYLFTFFFQR